MRRTIILLLGISLLSAPAAAKKNPSDEESWRAPTAVELGAPQDQKWRDASPTRYLTLSGDFDGDGKPDEARLMVRGDGKAYALFVKLAARDAPIKLDEFPDIKKLPTIGIKNVAPETYPTACARGLDCAEDEPRYIRVTRDAIDYFDHDVSDRYYYWSDTRHAFAQVGITG